MAFNIKRGANMREQTRKINALLEEFKQLKQKLFGSAMFVILDETHPDTKRYNQLLQYFYPQYRTSDFVNPLTTD